MLRRRIIDKISSSSPFVKIDQSRCLRMRFNKNSCNKCIEYCHANAIMIGEGVSIDRETCSECMLCISECLSGCFEIKGLDFYSLIGSLRKIQFSVQAPVLGCNVRTDILSHERTLCLGFLSEEHLIALSVFLDAPLQINLTGCSECRNGFIVQSLKERIKSINEKTSLDVADRLRLVDDKADLKYQEISYDRRGFFRAVKNFTSLRATELFSSEKTDETQAYSTKKLPFRKGLLNRVFSVVSDKNQREILNGYYYTVTVDENCDNCFACVGMCPTGALKIETVEHDRELFFNSSLCNGCGLCEDFCMNRSIFIKEGFFRDNPFEFNNAKREFLCKG